MLSDHADIGLLAPHVPIEARGIIVDFPQWQAELLTDCVVFTWVTNSELSWWLEWYFGYNDYLTYQCLEKTADGKLYAHKSDWATFRRGLQILEDRLMTMRRQVETTEGILQALHDY